MNPTIQPSARRRPLGVDESAQRLVWLDALRGLIIVIMALDHASNFIARVHPMDAHTLSEPRNPLAA